ncbi:MAG TPA: hypothetical protein VJZ00_06775 [Thermoanaerobaculia bacterium]|nr:hypothetical protein [Thermoanaerobaculia bacterium]
MLFSSIMVVAVVWLVTRARQRKVELQVEMQSKLIDRFGAAPELVDFLHSPAGRQFVSGVQGAPMILTRERILNGFSRAIVLTMLGAAFLFLTFWYNDAFAVPAAILFCLGLGYLVATFVAYKLSAKLFGGADSSNDLP